MLPSLAMAFIAGLLLGLQIPYVPMPTSLALLLAAFAGVALERFALVPVRSVTWCYGLLLGGVIYLDVPGGACRS